MSEVTVLDVEARERSGKGAARDTRRKGLVPGVIYGNKQTPLSIALEPRRLLVEMNKPGFFSRLFKVQAGGKAELCLVRDVQRHPVSDQPLHVDFLRVSVDSKVHVKVPVHFINQESAPGLKQGGVLNVVEHELELIAPAGNIPAALVVDLAGLEIGASIHAGILALSEGVSLVSHDPEMTIAAILAPTVGGTEEAEAAAPSNEAADASPSDA